MVKNILALISILAFSINVKAQVGFESILLANEDDANKLMTAYFSPSIEGFIFGMSNGWVHTAKVHKKLGFDITFSYIGSIPSEQNKTFSIDALELTSIKGASTAQTFVGSSTKTELEVTRTVTINNPDSPVNGRQQEVTAPLTLPGGVIDDFPLNAIPSPAVQVSVGLPFKTDVMLRLLPNTNIGGSNANYKRKINMFGVGLKKEITSLFGPMKRTPLHVSLLTAFTNMNFSYELQDKSTTNFIIENSLAEFKLNTFTVQAIASLNFPIINVYGGFGYSSGSSSLKFSGKYQGRYSYTILDKQYTETLDLTVPNLDFSASGFRTTLGTRLSLGFFKIITDYTIQKYNSFNLGLAFSFR